MTEVRSTFFLCAHWPWGVIDTKWEPQTSTQRVPMGWLLAKWNTFIVDGLTKWYFGVMSLGPNISEGSKTMSLEWDITPKYWREPLYIQAFRLFFSITRMKEKLCLCGYSLWGQACRMKYFRWSSEHLFLCTWWHHLFPRVSMPLGVLLPPALTYTSRFIPIGLSPGS